jgi:predicted protein tyrosine phosphatase
MDLFTIIRNGNIRAQTVADSAHTHMLTIALVDERAVVFASELTVSMLNDRINDMADDLTKTFTKINRNEQQLLKSISFTY